MVYLLSSLVILLTTFLVMVYSHYKKEREKKKMKQKEKQVREERIKILLLANPQTGLREDK